MMIDPSSPLYSTGNVSDSGDVGKVGVDHSNPIKQSLGRTLKMGPEPDIRQLVYGKSCPAVSREDSKMGFIRAAQDAVFFGNNEDPETAIELAVLYPFFSKRTNQP